MMGTGLGFWELMAIAIVFGMPCTAVPIALLVFMITRKNR